LNVFKSSLIIVLIGLAIVLFECLYIMANWKDNIHLIISYMKLDISIL